MGVEHLRSLKTIARSWSPGGRKLASLLEAPWLTLTEVVEGGSSSSALLGSATSEEAKEVR